jgi:hypothetical protein
LTDQLLIEAGIDGYLLEDNSGVLLIDQRVEVKDTTVGLVEATNKSWVKVIVNNLGLSGVSNISTGFVKNVVLSTLGLTGSNNYTISEFEYVLEDGTGSYELEDGLGVYLQDYPLQVNNTTVSVTETSQKVTGFLKTLSETVGLSDVNNHIFGFFKVVTSALVGVEYVVNKILTEVNFYGLEDGTGRYINEDGTGGRYLLDQLAIVQNIAFTVGITEASQKFLGPIKMILDTIELREVNQRLMTMFRNTTGSTIGVTEASNRLGTIIRNFSTTVGITEAFNRLRTLIRLFPETVGITEASQGVEGRLKVISDTIGLTEATDKIRGILRTISDALGITEASNKVKIQEIIFDFGELTVLMTVSYDDFIVYYSNTMGDMVGIDSLNSGSMNIRNG